MAETTVLFTGATGFLGGATTAEFLGSSPVGRALFLIRAPNPVAGLDRLRRSLARFRIGDDLLNSLSTNQVLCGDLGEVREFSGDPRLDTVTHVVNCAAITAFSNHPRLWPVNVEGTLQFGIRMSRNGQLRRFVHVGTAMACGPNCDSPVRETWSLPPRERHLVAYTASKAEGELRLHLEVPNLPLVVARPSIIIGHSKLGCSVSSSIFWVFKMAQMLEQFPCELDDRIDVVPVDYCARSLCALTFKPNLNFDLYHVSAGSFASDTFRDIDAALAAAQRTESIAPRFRKLLSEDIPKLLPEFSRLLAGCNRRLIARALRTYGAFSSLSYVFDNNRLLSEGMPAPARFSSYIGACVDTSQRLSVAEQMLADLK